MFLIRSIDSRLTLRLSYIRFPIDPNRYLFYKSKNIKANIVCNTLSIVFFNLFLFPIIRLTVTKT